MQKIFILLVLFFTCTSVSAQSAISVSFHQDLKLAFYSDESGNSAGTLDVLAQLKYQAKQDEIGYFICFLNFEKANILNGFTRIGGAIGYTFNQLFNDSNFEIAPSAGFGSINRNNQETASWAASINIAYKIGTRIKIGTIIQFVNRTDLRKEPTRFSLLAGIEINLFRFRPTIY